MTNTLMTAYETQLNDKLHRLQQHLAPYYKGSFDVYASSPQHHRLRAEFRVWHEGDTWDYVMTPKGQKPSPDSIIRMSNFPTASLRINELMPMLKDAVCRDPVLRNRLYQVEFLSTLRGNDLITLIYHQKLDETWEQHARALEDKLNTAIVGRSRKQKVTLSRDYVEETLHINGQPYHYRQYEGSFTQPNGAICEKMVSWASDHNNHPDQDLLELYCGNGNFTIPLAKGYRKVLATEISKSGVSAVKENMVLNDINTIKVARLSAQEFTQAWRSEREFNRLKSEGIFIKDYNFAGIFVDPPRAGIDEQTIELLKAFDQITYISCNPESLVTNLSQLDDTHEIRHAALFDQFPFTPHIESGVILIKRNKVN